MKTHEFTIVATGLSLDDVEWEDRFYEAGCDDALAAMMRGVFVLRFDREADSLEQAIASAMRDVEAAGASVTRVEPDPLVSASDIAERSGLSRQLISLYANGSRGKAFPRPVACASTTKPLWSWSEVAAWLADTGKLDSATADTAKTIEEANARIGGSVHRLEAVTLIRHFGDVEAKPYTKIGHYLPGVVGSGTPGGPPKFRTNVGTGEAPGASFLHPEIEAAA